ncbi:serpin B8-like [Drosophila serrata]|uniref:serpin B8-like n=1 Tax=Drosophila serrata TaxID=7274 RepID=UPI000A1D0EA2|nr:serpin B8-like [Drosophila serrata]
MKAFTGLLGMLLLGAILAEDISKKPSQSKNRAECTNFAGDLYYRVQESLPEEQHFVISPLGVSSLLGTLLFAVDQTSAIEIANFLYPKCRNPDEDISSPSILERQGSRLSMATVALVRDGVAVDKKFENQAAELGSYVFRTNFLSYRNEFNDFFTSKTNERRLYPMDPGLLTDPPGPESRLLFYNGMRYTGRFGQKFSYLNGKLFAPRVQALHGHIPELKAQVLGLPLLNTTSCLLILRPDIGVELKSVAIRLRTVDVRQLPSQLNPTTMDITLKQMFEKSYIFLREPLMEAGITSVFNETTADLSAFNKEVPLDDALVVTLISLFENGINTDEEDSNYDIEKIENSVAYPKFEALNNFIYAIVDPERVYLMGRRTESKW